MICDTDPVASLVASELHPGRRCIYERRLKQDTIIPARRPFLVGAATTGSSSGPSYSRQTDSLEGPLEDVRRLGAADLHRVPARLADDEVRHAPDAPRFL